MKTETPIKGTTACLTCGAGSHDTLPLDALLAVGFGDVNATKDEEFVYSEAELGQDAEDYPSLQHIEDLALADPDHDWRVHFYGPMHEAHYQRQGVGHWVLYEKGEGFA